MIQKCSIINVLEVFFREPTNIHFIREISKKINLAPTSVKNNLNELLNSKLILKKESRPFNGFVANRENEKFLFYKRAYNLYASYNLKKEIIEILHPKAIIIFGSYSIGEDIETSDIDILIISHAKKELNFEKFEESLGRKINVINVSNLNKLDENIQKKVMNGVVLHGGF